MSIGIINSDYLDELGTIIRNLGYPQYTEAQKFTIKGKEGAIQLKDVIQHIGKLNLVNSISQEKLALKDIPARCFVTEKTSVVTSDNINISESAALLIRAQKLSDDMIMAGWIEALTHKLYVRILKKNEEGLWAIKAVKQIAVNNAQGFDMIKFNENVVVLGYTTDTSQGFLRLDINNDTVREHGEPTILTNVGYKNIKLCATGNLNQVEFRYFLWGYDEHRYGCTLSNTLTLDPYDSNSNGTTQVMKVGDRYKILHVQDGPNGLDWISYTVDSPYALNFAQVTADEIFIVRIGGNYNVITEMGRRVNELWWVDPEQSAQGGVYGSSAVAMAIATPSKAVVCYNGQNAVWGVIAPLRSKQRPASTKLLEGVFERLNLVKINNETYWLAAYGKGENSAQSKLVKIKVDIQNNTFSTIYEDNLPGLQGADIILTNNIDAIICANQYNMETQNSKLIAQTKTLGLGVVAAKAGDNIVGVSSRAALQGNYIPVEMVQPPQ